MPIPVKVIGKSEGVWVSESKKILKYESGKYNRGGADKTEETFHRRVLYGLLAFFMRSQ